MEKIDFLSEDELKMTGLLYNSQDKTNKVILAVHGMTSDCFKERDAIFASLANKENIDYFCFNNRGSELVKYITRANDGKKIIAGTSYEDILEAHNDIIGAIRKLKELGYKEIYLQGHSLGCTKIIYTYNKMKEENNELIKCIKKVILLSLVDIPKVLKTYIGEAFDKHLKFAEQKEKEGKINDLMPENNFIQVVSVKTFLRYMRDNEKIDFAKYGTGDEFEKLNNIDVPLFMRWGNNNEMILQEAKEIVEELNKKIKNKNKDIDFIDGANHGYHGKEIDLGKEIISFIKESEK